MLSPPPTNKQCVVDIESSSSKPSTVFRPCRIDFFHLHIDENEQCWSWIPIDKPLVVSKTVSSSFQKESSRTLSNYSTRGQEYFLSLFWILILAFHFISFRMFCILWLPIIYISLYGSLNNVDVSMLVKFSPYIYLHILREISFCSP